MSEAAGGRVFIDLHCHTSASHDSLSRPGDVVRAAAARGLTHLAITDHDRIEGALAARDAAPAGLCVIVGEEIRTREGDLIGLFLERSIPPGLAAREAAAEVREQGGLVGLPHPFDRFRGSLLAGGATPPGGTGALDALAPSLDYVEAFNARVPFPAANERAAAYAAAHGLPGVAVSDAHTLLEVGIAYVVASGPVGDAAELRATLVGARLVTGRASYLVRAVTPIARVVQRLRGRGRIPPVRER